MQPVSGKIEVSQVDKAIGERMDNAPQPQHHCSTYPGSAVTNSRGVFIGANEDRGRNKTPEPISAYARQQGQGGIKKNKELLI